MKFIIPSVLAALLIAAVVPSCYPSYGLTTTDYRTVVTVYDTAADFDQLRTYYIVDSVFHILGDVEDDDITREYDRKLIDAVDANFQSYGWTRIIDTTGGVRPATLVRISATGQVTSGAYWNWWYPWYGGGYWGYPGWGWGWYYPPGYWGTYSYSTGSLIVQQDQITFPATLTDSLQLQPIWIGSSNGLLSSTTSSNVQIISYELRQMFDQSPYLALTPQP